MNFKNRLNLKKKKRLDFLNSKNNCKIQLEKLKKRKILLKKKHLKPEKKLKLQREKKKQRNLKENKLNEMLKRR